MIKNRVAQLVFQTIYCVLGVIGAIAGLGIFNASFHGNFYVYYTNLSNYICLGLMFVCLVRTIKAANKKEDGACNVAPRFNFTCVVLILVTFFVYNILLAGEKTALEYFTSLSNMLLHVILPLMFLAHWILFYKHDSVKWYWPLLCVIMPIVYIIFILIRAAIIGPGTDALLYPYFFLNIDKLGWGGFFMWIGILFVVFVALGYIIYALDNIKTIINKFKKSDK